MDFEHKTEKGSIYLEEGNRWYHVRNGNKLELYSAMKIPFSALQGVLSKYGLKHGDIIQNREKLFKELKKGKGVSLSDKNYVICFAYRNKNESNFRLGYSSSLIGEESIDDFSTGLELIITEDEEHKSEFLEEQKVFKGIQDKRDEKDKESKQPK